MKIFSVILGILLLVFLKDLYETVVTHGNPFIPLLICLSIIFIGVSGFKLQKKYYRVLEFMKK